MRLTLFYNINIVGIEQFLVILNKTRNFVARFSVEDYAVRGSIPHIGYSDTLLQRQEAVVVATMNLYYLKLNRIDRITFPDEPSTSEKVPEGI